MKRRKQILPRFITKRFRVPPGATFQGLKDLFVKSGLIDRQGQPTPEGEKALKS